LLTLGSSGSIKQLPCCGLLTVKDQFKLKHLLAAADHHSDEIKVTQSASKWLWQPHVVAVE